MQPAQDQLISYPETVVKELTLEACSLLSCVNTGDAPSHMDEFDYVIYSLEINK